MTRHDDLTLRRLGPADQPALTELFENNAVPEVTRWFDPFPLSRASAQTICTHTGRDLYWGVYAGSRLVGFAMVRGWDDGHPQLGFGVLVDRGHTRAGVGVATARLVLDDLRERRVPEVRARVHEDNVGSVRTLIAAGYEEIQRGGGRIILRAAP